MTSSAALDRSASIVKRPAKVVSTKCLPETVADVEQQRRSFLFVELDRPDRFVVFPCRRNRDQLAFGPAKCRQLSSEGPRRCPDRSSR